jgi:hypothetical protein
MLNFANEMEGQIDFYRSFLYRIDSTFSMENVLSDNNDGVVKGNLIEFKLNINDLNSTLFQAIKYLSSMRVKGKSIPSNIVLISLNEQLSYIYKSDDYLAAIETLYIGGASKNNVGFQASTEPILFDYSDDLGAEKLIRLLRSNNYTKIHIDENCIVGWATRYYREVRNAKKSDFIGEETGKVKIIGEIRRPEEFKNFIHPYTGGSNVRFQYLMDRLNDDLQKKNLGAFYTPSLYAMKSIELLRQAIARVPKGNDYIILDRCAGTGNLELQLSDEELSHCIVSTYEYYEYKVLSELLGDKVRHIIPPTEKEDTFNRGTVRGADALSEEYINSSVVQQYIQNQECTIILFENPPYAESTSLEHQRQGKGKESSVWKKSYVAQEMKKEVSGSTLNDLANAFIWSAFKYYLRQDTDSYIVYSPVKYWKSQHLISKEFLDGFAFNRKHFHTNISACIMCALWSNKNKEKLEKINLIALDIKDEKLVLVKKKLSVEKVHTFFSQKYYDKRKFPNDDANGILVELNGKEREGGRLNPKWNDNILGYLVADSVGFDNPDAKSSLVVAGRYNGNGFFLRKDNFLEKLPMFASSRYINYNRDWTERGRVMKSADGSKRFIKDVKNGKLEQFLLKCLLFTVLEMQNHMRTFIGSDGRFYRNELCLDTTNGFTIASTYLSEYLIASDQETKLFHQWEQLFRTAQKTKKYNPESTYGVYQIFDELNTTYLDESQKKQYNYPDLNGDLITLRTMVKEYYNSEIVPTLFEYKFLK